MSKLRWDSYVLLKGEDKVKSFLTSHLKEDNRKVLFILGKGFDVRMNTGIKLVSDNFKAGKVDCILIEFDEGQGSTSNNYKSHVDSNISELSKLINLDIQTKKISLWKGRGRNRRRIGDREAANIISTYEDINSYTDIIVDISALPRGIYFSLLGKLLTLIDKNKVNNKELHNLFVLTSENAKIDQVTKEDDPDDDLRFSHGFGGGLELTSDHPIIWFPILGENKLKNIDKAHNKINPHEICPLLPFPSKDPRRSDTLLIEYHQLLFDELRIEPQNILYVPEQNPFEVYRNLAMAIDNYNETLSIINGCKAAISTFSSKLLSIGALITAYELNNREGSNKIGVGVLNVDSKGYRIEDETELETLKNESELFLTWLTGEPYNEI